MTARSCSIRCGASTGDLKEVKALPGNDKCCDCGMKHPQWASVSFGNVFCLECSGVHRYVVHVVEYDVYEYISEFIGIVVCGM